MSDQDRTIPERPVGELDDEDAELELRLADMVNGEWWEKWEQPTWPMLVGFVVLVCLPISALIVGGFIWLDLPVDQCGQIVFGGEQ